MEGFANTTTVGSALVMSQNWDKCSEKYEDELAGVDVGISSSGDLYRFEGRSRELS
jgi:hypothetical protein